MKGCQAQIRAYGLNSKNASGQKMSFWISTYIEVLLILLIESKQIKIDKLIRSMYPKSPVVANIMIMMKQVLVFYLFILPTIVAVDCRTPTKPFSNHIM